MQVEVDLGMNAAANARARHEVRKRAVAKQRKTVEANAWALAAAEQKTASTLAQVQPTAISADSHCRRFVHLRALVKVCARGLREAAMSKPVG
jgi:hypothetical protein